MIKERIYIASDHAGFVLKNDVAFFLREGDYLVEDIGPREYDGEDDYNDYADLLCGKVLEDGSKGILICGTGQGMSESACRYSPQLRAEVCWNESTARHAKEHTNAHILCFGQNEVGPELAKKMVKIWLETEFVPHERHLRRQNKQKMTHERGLNS